jgi:hypothetical protein
VEYHAPHGTPPGARAGQSLSMLTPRPCAVRAPLGAGPGGGAPLGVDSTTVIF